jgi:methionine-rich copper-binding protein CopC
MDRIILALVATFSLSAPAFAHAHLVGAAPADHAVVSTAPTELTLQFSEGVSLRFTSIVVTGPGEAAIAFGTATLDPQDDKQLIVPIAGSLAAGTYTVTWHALATDGHKSTGTYSFSVK